MRSCRRVQVAWGIPVTSLKRTWPIQALCLPSPLSTIPQCGILKASERGVKKGPKLQFLTLAFRGHTVALCLVAKAGRGPTWVGFSSVMSQEAPIALAPFCKAAQLNHANPSVYGYWLPCDLGTIRWYFSSYFGLLRDGQSSGTWKLIPKQVKPGFTTYQPQLNNFRAQVKLKKQQKTEQKTIKPTI